MKVAVVTGANGFLGRSLVNLLIDNGYYVYCMDVFFPEIDEDEKCKRNIICNLNDLSELDIPENPDIFYHLAWEGVSTDKKDDYFLQFNNIKYSLNCFNFAKRINSKRFVFVGSASEYAYSNLPIDGYSLLPAPCDAYSAVKASIHINLELLSSQIGLDYIRILFPSIYGGKRNDANIITYAINTLLSNKKPSFTKLEQIWEYVYIDDAIRALFQIGTRGLNGKSYPVGWNKRETLAHFIYQIRDLIDSNLELGIGDKPYKTAQIDHCIVDTTQTLQDTGFKPEVPFEKGIQETIDYLKSLR